MTTNRSFRTAHAGLAALVCALVFGAFTLGSSKADATAVRAARPSAVAVVDLSQLLNGLEERKYLETELNAEIDSRQNELDSIVKQIETMQEDIKMIPEGDTSGTRVQKIRDMRIKEVEARALRQFVQEQLSLEKGQMLATLYNKVQNAVCDILARDGWDVVLIDDSGLALPQMAQENQMLQLILQRRVLCAADGVDITEDVKTLMNNNFNAPRP